MFACKNILSVLILLSSSLCMHGRDHDSLRGRYEELDLYYSLIESELRDSFYRKTYIQYMTRKPDTEHRKPKTNAVTELETMSEEFTEAFWQTKDYERAFHIGFRLEEKLSLVSESDFPRKRETYYKLGEAYYLMLDFHKSIGLLRNALSAVPRSFDDQVNLDALNIIAICYANIGHIDISDNYFRMVLVSNDIVRDRPIYNALAVSHLGCNAMLSGQYDKAIALSEAVWPTLRNETEDYGHLAGMCYCRGRSYLEKGDFRRASIWIDSLVYFAGKDRYNPSKRIKQAHLLRADYYTAVGDAQQAKAYNDLLVDTYRYEEKNHISYYIAQASYRYNQEKIDSRDAELRKSCLQLTFISMTSAILLAVTLVILGLYRRINAAYKALAQKADRWAREDIRMPNKIYSVGGCNVNSGGDNSNGHNGNNGGDKMQNGGTNAEDVKLFLLVENEMTKHFAYREAGLTAESLSERIGVHRNTLSRAINRATGQNFNQYINGYRIKDAVKIIAGSNHDQIRIGELYEHVGFTNRSTFYRTFKLFTGISPIDFQKNKTASQK